MLFCIDFSDFEDQQDDFYREPTHQDNFETDDEEEKYEFIKPTKNLFPKEQYEHKGIQEKLEAEARFGDYPDNLLRRPKKGFMWGLGTQVMNEKTHESEFFTMHKLPTIRQVIKFLEVNQSREIKVIDTRSLGVPHLTHFAILGNCFSTRHLHYVAKSLVAEVKKL